MLTQSIKIKPIFLVSFLKLTSVPKKIRKSKDAMANKAKEQEQGEEEIGSFTIIIFVFIDQ